MVLVLGVSCAMPKGGPGEDCPWTLGLERNERQSQAVDVRKYVVAVWRERGGRRRWTARPGIVRKKGITRDKTSQEQVAALDEKPTELKSQPKHSIQHVVSLL